MTILGWPLKYKKLEDTSFVRTDKTKELQESKVARI